MAEPLYTVRLTKAELWEASQAIESIWESERNKACQSAARKLSDAYGKAHMANERLDIPL